MRKILGNFWAQKIFLNNLKSWKKFKKHFRTTVELEKILKTF